MGVAAVANSFKKSFKHTVRNWPTSFKHLGRAAGELAEFALVVTAPVMIFVVYPLVAGYNRWRARK